MTEESHDLKINLNVILHVYDLRSLWPSSMLFET